MKAKTPKILCLAAVLSVCSCQQDGPPELTPIFPPEDLTHFVGPYIGHTTQTSVSIGWETENPAETRLHWGESRSLGKLATGEYGTMHRVTIEGLQPGRRYHYRACSAGACTGDLVFDTAPAAGTAFSFGVYADCQDNPDIHRQVADLLIGGGAWLALVAGDLVSDGSVRAQYKERYFDPARRFAQVRPRYPAVGNHDRKDVEVAAFIDYNILPEDPAVPQPETSYSFTYGDAFFLAFDNTLDHFDLFFPLSEDHQPPLWLWLKEQASSPAARAARWRFAFAHYPPASNCYPEGHQYGLPEQAVRDFVIPLLRENGFHAYFAGHIHCYERFDYDGFLAITAGGGGGATDDQADCDDGLPEARVQACVHHAVLVELGRDLAKIRAVGLDGRVIDEVEIPSGPRP